MNVCFGPGSILLRWAALVVWIGAGLTLAAAEAERHPAPNPSPLFEEVSTNHTGVTFVHRFALDHPLAYLYESGYPCGGVCVGDVNGDGKPDILLISGPDDNALFLNKGDFVFEPAAPSSALADWNRWGVSAALADLDNDSDLDVFICNYNGPNRLLLNDGHGQFTECGTQAGIAFVGPSQCVYAADFDRDGDLDLFLLTNRLYSRAGRPRGAASERGPDGQPRIKEEFAPFFRIVRPSMEAPPDPALPNKGAPPPFMLEYGHSDRLYRNDGPGPDGIPRFTDVTRGSGLEDVPGHGLSALVWDINDDGWPDIYVANDYTDKDHVWLNLGPRSDGSFGFRDAVEEFLPYMTWSSMGSDVADVNGDGRLDFMVADMAGTTHFKEHTTTGEITGWRRWVLEHGWPRQTMRNTLFLNSGASRFQEIAFQAGVARSDWTWAVKFGDFDLDGRVDLFLATGDARLFTDSDVIVTPLMLVGRPLWDAFKDKAEGREKNLAFRNEDGLRFSDVSRAWNLDKNSMSYGAATADFDADGDLDLIVCNLGENVSLYRNQAAQSGARWLKVRLQGLKNRYGIGAKVTAHLPDGRRLVRLMNPHTGFLSGNEPVLHFGLGKADKIERLEVQWPESAAQFLKDQPANQLLIVREADAATNDVPALPTVQAVTPYMTEIAERIGLQFKHRENPYDDFERELLLPARLSRLGPGIAVSDLNGDGLDEIFVGGASGQSAVLFIHQTNHTFRPLENPPWAVHADTEDMGAVFFDADRDGDLDLYVASGGNEWESNHVHYLDRLYLNQTPTNGPVAFSEAPPGALPNARESGSCVIASDFDRDGDLDLFVGARSVPGKYPLSPESILLRNDGNRGEPKFADVTDTAAPGLRRVGLVTGALWTDVDNDGWADLLVTCEWGPVAFFRNHKGQLVNATAEAGLATRLGWWNSVTGADLDGDGDIDYAVLNAGLNTKYGQLTPENRVVLYRGDMDYDGLPELVEAISTARGEWPVRGRAPTGRAIPFVKEKFATYRAFAAASLPDIYNQERLDQSLRVAANELQSGLLINESTPGQPRFVWRPLPPTAQLSPAFGVVSGSFCAGNQPSLVLAQNLFSREPETGLWRGALGCVVCFSSDSQWVEQDYSRTGFVVPGDGKGLAVADVDGNGWPDLLAAQNNHAVLAFQNRSRDGWLPLVVRLTGPLGNPSGIGARIQVLAGTNSLGTTEVHAGSGYLSQSSSAAFFLRPRDAQPTSLSIRWPGGQTTVVPVKADETLVWVRSSDSP